MPDNILLNSVTTNPVGDTSRFIEKTGGVKTQVVTIDVGGSGAETLVAGSVPVTGTVAVSGTTTISGTVVISGTPNVVITSGTVTVVPKAILTFRVRYSTTQTNTAILTPGAAWALSSFGICVANSSTDEQSIVVGIAAATTPTNSQVIFAHPGITGNAAIQITNGLGDIGEGGSGDSLLITTGTITTFTFDVFGTYYLK